jgi:catechol 2,3-dioxygenase-like lactoylglutathione lyase family enzyme
MTIQRMDHVGIVVEDLAAATAFFVELGLQREPVPSPEPPSLDGYHLVPRSVDRVGQLDGQRLACIG